jgi:hypothetical protein
MRHDTDDRSEMWDVRDPADLLRRMGSAMPFLPGEIRLAAVEDASTVCRLLGQLRVEPAEAATAEEDSYVGYKHRKQLLHDLVVKLPVAVDGQGPPWTTVVLVSARHGRVVPGIREHLWEQSMRVCLDIPIRCMLRGDRVLLTEHGWLVEGTSLAGEDPRLAPPWPVRSTFRRSDRAPGAATVSSASRTSSSRAGSG